MFRASSASPLWSVACFAQINRATSVLQRSHEQGILPQIFSNPKIPGTLYQTLERMQRHTNEEEIRLGAYLSWGRTGIAAKMRYAFGIPRQGCQRRRLPNAMPP
jgi:hypothetical protein